MKNILLAVLSLCLAMSAVAQETGFRKSVEIYGGPVLTTDRGKYVTGLSLTAGYQFTPHLYAGVGGGFRHTRSLFMIEDKVSANDCSIETHYSYGYKYLLPLFGRVQYTFDVFPVKPLLMLDMGYAFNVPFLPDDINELWFCEPAVGAEVGLGGKTALYFYLGVDVQRLQYRFYTTYSQTAYEEEIHRTFYLTLDFKAGLRF